MILAAGMGKRLGKFTQNQAKCMVKVGGITLIERSIDAIKKAGIKKLILVVGYEADKLKKFIEKNVTDIDVEFVENQDYASTNNIYSLYLARSYLSKDDTILMESDLIYESKIIQDMVSCEDKNLVAVAKYKHWMDGTVTLLNAKKEIIDFIEKKDFRYNDVDTYYKTVNIYKFSKDFSANQYIPFLNAYIKAYGKNKYYELVLKAIAHLSSANLKAFNVDDTAWYEIDDAQDLNIANTLFAKGEEKLRSYERHFGGYWRFTDLKDFCYLVNPYYPPKKMVDHLQYFFDTLLRNYPSGMKNLVLAAGKMFHVDESFILVGNGAAELINVLGRVIKGNVALSLPSFNEYVRCFKECEIKAIFSNEDDYRLNKDRIIEMSKSCDAVFIINPDNPSGSFIPKNEIIEILNACKENNTICVVDESFIDFAEQDIRYTLVKNKILKDYPNLIVIKSISKSYGVPGLRLGILATSNTELLKTLHDFLPVWNINSFAEYFMQINGSYEKEYIESCNNIARQRKIMIEHLQKISYLKVYESQANYIMCKVTSGITSIKLASKLLKEYNILIKDLSKKKGFFKKNYIRLAVKDESQNILLYNALLKIEKEIKNLDITP